MFFSMNLIIVVTVYVFPYEPASPVIGFNPYSVKKSGKKLLQKIKLFRDKTYIILFF